MAVATREPGIKTNGNGITAIGPVSNDAEPMINMQAPYVAHVSIEGVAPLLLHAWSCDAVDAKAAAAKGSRAKKTDNLESYVYRCDDGTIGIPGRYLIGSIIDKRNGAAKYLQDPRSPRKSALDLYKAGVVSTTILASLGADNWDYVDRQRVVIQNSGITRERPAFHAGWKAEFELQVLTPEYISPQALLTVLNQAGRLVGIGDYRPTYGRFNVTSFKIQTE